MAATSVSLRQQARATTGAASARGQARTAPSSAPRAAASLGSSRATTVTGGFGAATLAARSNTAGSTGVVRAAPVAAIASAAGEQYDYILVGGGTAGCILANKLTADGTKSVLLLEAGADNTASAIKVPAGITRLFHSNLDWGLYTKSMSGLNDASMYLARGKVLGGSSSTNATLYHRGSRADYERWGMGEDWTAEECYKWFKKSEDRAVAEDNAHGSGGPMYHERPRYQSPMHDAFLKSAAAAGLKHNPDFNDWDRDQEGFGEFDVTQDTGTRADMYQRQLKPALGRSNLTVISLAHVTKIVMDTAGPVPTAKAVEFSVGATPALDGSRETASLKAGGEVLLTAGAVHSPHIMKLSGMGPASELEDAGVPVVLDLPAVGENLQDHPACLAAFYTDAKTMTDELFRDNGNIRVRAAAKYALQKRGPLASTGCDRGAFVRTSAAPTGQPDLQIRYVPAFSIDANGVSSYAMFGRMKEQGLKWPSGVTFQLVAIRPQSRGSVTLRSADPYEQPNVDAGSLRHPSDLATLREGIRLVRNIAQQDPLQECGAREGWPGAGVESNESLDAYIRRSLHSANALVGTCRMGPAGSSVVGSSCQVHGANGLRIVDSSVVPTIPGGQTGAVTAMIAERLAAHLTGSEPLAEEPEAPAPALQAV